MLPGWVDPDKAAGHTGTYELRLRGYASYVYEFTGGDLDIDPPEHRPFDVHISSDPITALLTSYGRIGQVGPALTGKVRV